MELKIRAKDNTEKGKLSLPPQFKEQIRPDLVKRAVLTIEANMRQPYGANPRAGQRHSAEVSRRRRNYRGSYGHGISRVPRKVLSRRGTQFFWQGAVAPGTVGGRKAHPPKPSKEWGKKLNIKERRKAIRSALAATVEKTIVQERGHQVPATYPFILDAEFESIAKTKDLKKALVALGLQDELKRCEAKKVRAGKGKVRGRRYKKKKGPLIVVSDDCKLFDSAANIPGIDIVKVQNINAKLLAPGCHVGRLTLFTNTALDKMDKGGLFL